MVAFQEVGDPTTLDDLLTRVGRTWYSSLSTHPDTRGIRVAFASRLPITATTEAAAFAAGLAPVQSDTGGTASSPSRGFLQITATVPGLGAVQFVTAHLKSNLLTYPNGRFQPRDEGERARFSAFALYKRAAEATSRRVHMTGILAGAGTTTPAILLGDMNDDPQAATTQILLGPPGSEIGTPGEGRPDHGDADRLLNLAPNFPSTSSTAGSTGDAASSSTTSSSPMLCSPPSSTCRAARESPPAPTCGH